MNKLYLQNIVEDISFDHLPATWQTFNISYFSNNKTLFDFQKDALKNAVKALYLYFKDKNAEKSAMFDHFKRNGLEEDLDFDLKKKQENRSVKYLLEYPTDYPVFNNKISFAHFINQMSFWMATGSGKTLIIVKLIEILGKLIEEKEIPQYDILFLTHRDDLLDQCKKHVEEFNTFNLSTKIHLKSLKEYDQIKRDNALPFFKNERTVFYYRSDLLSDEHKEKIINFKNYDNNGKWYVILDEAHKGDKEDSKRQILYSILARNGFLFNFSATFTHPRDFVTCVFNFNLSKFIEKGYGKHIHIVQSNVSAFKNKTDFSPNEKQKIVLKTLLLLTHVIQQNKKIRNIDHSLYHSPLLVTLVNSVNTEQSDLEIFFRELEKIANNEIASSVLEEAKQELINDIQENPQFLFESSRIAIDTKSILEIKTEDILKYIFNASKPGRIEVLKTPGNTQELIFQLMTAEKPFGLIKIGDISEWLKNKLQGYEINERFENESYFKSINHDDSDIHLLMGSRSFYEGWDSNRPNLLLFINIGVGKDAKKFVLQSVGRGIRIEPKRYMRKRLQHLYNERQIDKDLFDRIKNVIDPLETLFIFGTNSENLKEIIETLKNEKKEKNLGEAFHINPKAKDYDLLIPTYKTSHTTIAEELDFQKYSINSDDLASVTSLYNFLGDKVLLVKYDLDVHILKKIRQSFEQTDQYYQIDRTHSYIDPELSLRQIFSYFGIKGKKIDGFKKLEDEIVHFKNIGFIDGEKYEEVKKKIEEVKHRPEREKALNDQYGKISREEFEKQLTLFKEAEYFEMNNQRIKIKYLANHYYLPIILSESEKIEYISHIINVNSEVTFIEQLEEYVSKPNNFFSTFDWWMFSKIDQTIDDVSIPYYNPEGNNIAHFKPDFIFWMKKGKTYFILFIDPKGTEHASAYRKIDGYSKLFEIKKEQQKRSKIFSYDGYSVKVKLLLKSLKGIASVPENYRQYWFDNFTDFEHKLLYL